MARATIAVLLVLLIDAAHGQGAQMAGGRPPSDVERRLCDIGTVFAKLMEIKGNPQCTAGCAQGSGDCPEDWYPGAA